MDWLQIEGKVYWLVFVGTFLGVAIWETYRPQRQLLVNAGRRWRNHGIVWLSCAILLSLLARVSPVLIAVSVADSPYGLLNRNQPAWAIRWLLAVGLLDFAKYLMHRGLHKIPGLWRFHEVHHSDPDFDLSTGLRVHPVEMLYNQACYLSAIAVLAPPISAVVAAELTSLFMSLFGHANASLPALLERVSRYIFVSPDMHRIHHSEEIPEQNANFGDIFPWWDRVFGTYLADPAGGQAGLILGIRGQQEPTSLSVGFMFRLPFRTKSVDVNAWQGPR
ncbi:MAG TPA: sterol desaturase family protein [Alphaproteobacteria bacterium]|nr:sterol desaturase family protein [Alphaproteobacteria bacterium]